VRAGASAPAALLQVARAGYGGALLIVPGPVIRLATGRPAGPRARAVARVLGARHLLQAALTVSAGPGSASLLVGAAVDLLHAASMAGLSLADRQARRLTLPDALIETTFAAAGVSAARAGQTTGQAGSQPRTGLVHWATSLSRTGARLCSSSR
jgi:hypothetical protein